MSDQGWLQKLQTMLRTGQINDAAVGAGGAAQAAQQLQGRNGQIQNALAQAMGQQQQPQLTVEQILELQRLQAQNAEPPKQFRF